MQELIVLSNDYVSARFTYQGFARFSRQLSVAAMAKVAKVTRDQNVVQGPLQQTLQQMNDQVDAERVPLLDSSPLSQKILQSLQQFEQLHGFWPEPA